MILIADSGSTKTDWRAVAPDGTVSSFVTRGMNPLYVSAEDMESSVRDRIFPYLGAEVDVVYFYGAGVTGDVERSLVKSVFSSVFSAPEVFIESDILGAARSVCGDSEGLVCIMGTGSNSCLYDGSEIVRGFSSGGYVLGDEGSGASLGRLLLSDYIKNLLPEKVASELKARYGLSYQSIVSSVYRDPYPSAYLASFSPFISEFSDVPEIRDMILSSFRSLFARSLARYGRDTVSFTGSVAYFYSRFLAEVASEYGMSVGRIRKSPADGLVSYHMEREVAR